MYLRNETDYNNVKEPDISIFLNKKCIDQLCSVIRQMHDKTWYMYIL